VGGRGVERVVFEGISANDSLPVTVGLGIIVAVKAGQ